MVVEAQPNSCCKYINNSPCGKQAETYYLSIHEVSTQYYPNKLFDLDIAPFCKEHDYPAAGIKITKQQAEEFWIHISR